MVVTRARKDEEAPLRVLFVCTANVSRSPYAERRAAQRLAGLGGAPVTVSSAGIPGYPGRSMDEQMASQLRARGADPEGHVSRSLTAELLSAADLVVTFEFGQRMRIIDAWPEQGAKVFGLRQLGDALGQLPADTDRHDLPERVHAVSAPDSMGWDVRDPYRRGSKAARVCADDIDAALRQILPTLVRG